MTDSAWQIGDTVSLCPDGREENRARGIITAIDENGMPRGVRVQLFTPVLGSANCYATHDELTLVSRGQS